MVGRRVQRDGHGRLAVLDVERLLSEFVLSSSLDMRPRVVSAKCFVIFDCM